MIVRIWSMLICSNAYVIIHFEIGTSVDQKTDELFIEIALKHKKLNTK